ncbi:hypothetical protein PVAP13_5NG062981 [Panicum virgatum]|uniref:Uncharacterized protein n=1 Tax=Panicum virgatum TaxID=38727 RepID=A0A8T0RPZ4_PANVG|nr:hypothetical protein PVAP13_5NG062981 [Panicum virgatum]
MHRRDRESEDSLVAAAELLPDERPEVPLRRAALRRRGVRLLPPHGGLGAHHLGRGEVEAPPQLVGLQHAVLVADGGPDPGAEPLHQPRVGALVRPLGHPHGGHAARHALQRRVPAAVRDEAPHGRVRQHPHLVAPLHHHAALAAERRRVAGALAAAVVLPQHPQERPPARRHAARHLLDLPLAHHRQAPERDVHHRAGRLRVQPLEVARAVLLEQVVAAVLRDGHAPGPRRLVEEGEHGADGDDVDAVLAQRRHRLGLHGVERVGEHAGAVLAAEHVDELAEHVGDERVRVVLGGVGDERRQVADAERREARDADGGHGVAARRGDGPVHAVGAAEEVQVRGEHGGRLDPVERGGHAVAAGHVGDPREQQRVDDERDGPPRGAEAFEDGPERAGADDPDLAHVVRVVVHGAVEPGVVAVGVGHVPHPRGVAVALAGRRPLLVAREHLAERGRGGGDGDARPRGAEQAAREVARRVDVALRRVGHHQEVRPGRPRLRRRPDLLHHGRHCDASQETTLGTRQSCCSWKLASERG